MTTTDQQAPVDAVIERLNDPAVAASLVTLLDNAELLSTLVLGLGGLVARGEIIMDSLADSVGDLKTASGEVDAELPTMAEVTGMARQLRAASPIIDQALHSPMMDPATIELLGVMSEAATEGAARARVYDDGAIGMRHTLKTMRDPDVQRGLTVVLEICRSLGQRMAPAPTRSDRP